jgi:hypothetical protein
MNILAATYHLKGLGGSETFTYTFVKELVELGHNVDVYTLYKGVVSNKLGKLIVDKPKDKYDVIFVNHILDNIKSIKGYKILTCHGTLGVENPVSGADKYIAISKEVQAHLAIKGYKSEVIFNGVDCIRFSPYHYINDKIKRVYSLCHGSIANEMVKEACKKLNISFSDERGWDVERYINEADLVVSLGRGVYEGMACGRSILVFDSRDYMPMQGDGIVTLENIEAIKECNCSGRSFKIPFTTETLVKEFGKYNSEQGLFNRRYALAYMNIKTQVQQYLQVFEKGRVRK